ncbi:MAG: hypothetical protein KUL86_14210 [Castellaniella sp.]|nr:hypothetical protein [Castellaniella sp.]
MSSIAADRSVSDLNRIISTRSRVLTPAAARFLHSVPPSFPEPFWLAHLAAEHQMALTVTQAAQLLGEYRPTAQHLLREAQRHGLLRSHANPLVHSGEALYQPTGETLGEESAEVPSALRGNASAINLRYALLRAEIISMSPSEHWLPYSAGAEWVMKRGITLRSYMPIVVRLAPRQRIIYEIVLPNEAPRTVVRRAKRRWLDLLAVSKEGEPIFVQLAALRDAVPALQAALDSAMPANAIRRQLRAVETSILVEGDHDTLVGNRIKLQAELAAIEKQGNPLRYLIPDVLELAV